MQRAGTGGSRAACFRIDIASFADDNDEHGIGTGPALFQ
jgi:hypothetical protein